MSIVSVLYSTFSGEQYRLAEVLSDYPALERVRIRVLSTGEVRHVHRNSIAWGVYA